MWFKGRKTRKFEIEMVFGSGFWNATEIKCVSGGVLWKGRNFSENLTIAKLAFTGWWIAFSEYGEEDSQKLRLSKDTILCSPRFIAKWCQSFTFPEFQRYLTKFQRNPNFSLISISQSIKILSPFTLVVWQQKWIN